MASTEDHVAPYVCAYTIALLPDVKEEDFEKHMLQDVLPQFELTSRPIGLFGLEHHFLKRRSDDRADRYVWQIRLLKVEFVASGTEDAMFAELDRRVRAQLVSFGIPVSRTILQEIGVTETIYGLALAKPVVLKRRRRPPSLLVARLDGLHPEDRGTLSALPWPSIGKSLVGAGSPNRNIGPVDHSVPIICSGSWSLCVYNSRTVPLLCNASESHECWCWKAVHPLHCPCNAVAYRQ